MHRSHPHDDFDLLKSVIRIGCYLNEKIKRAERIVAQHNDMTATMRDVYNERLDSAGDGNEYDALFQQKMISLQAAYDSLFNGGEQSLKTVMSDIERFIEHERSIPVFVSFDCTTRSRGVSEYPFRDEELVIYIRHRGDAEETPNNQDMAVVAEMTAHPELDDTITVKYVNEDKAININYAQKTPKVMRDNTMRS